MQVSVSQRSKLPAKPGVYQFKDEHGGLLYVGKAINLRNRVNSYFSKSGDGRSKLQTLVPQIQSIEVIEVISEFEALILEAALIKKYLPKYNTIAKDDKQPLYIGITIEEYPKVRTLRLTQVTEDIEIFGPFPSATIVKLVLKSLRKIFHFCTHKNLRGRPCLYAAIGLCEPCPRTVSQLTDLKLQSKLKRKYRQQISYLKKLLSGESQKVIDHLEKAMQQAAKQEKFEQAKEYRDTIQRIKFLLQPRNPAQFYLNNPLLAHEIRQYGLDELQRLLNLQKIQPAAGKLHRIEGYDISTMGGKQTTGSMVVFQSGEPLTSDYQRFKISEVHQHADVESMQEMLTRRFSQKHDNWPTPDLIMVDGGLPQLAAAQKSFATHGLSIPIVGLAKREELLYVPKYLPHEISNYKPKEAYSILRIPLNSPALHVVQHLRDEAHRFARKYHRLLRQKNALSKS